MWNSRMNSFDRYLLHCLRNFGQDIYMNFLQLRSRMLSRIINIALMCKGGNEILYNLCKLFRRNMSMLHISHSILLSCLYPKHSHCKEYCIPLSSCTQIEIESQGLSMLGHQRRDPAQLLQRDSILLLRTQLLECQSCMWIVCLLQTRIHRKWSQSIELLLLRPFSSKQGECWS